MKTGTRIGIGTGASTGTGTSMKTGTGTATGIGTGIGTGSSTGTGTSIKTGTGTSTGVTIPSLTPSHLVPSRTWVAPVALMALVALAWVALVDAGPPVREGVAQLVANFGLRLFREVVRHRGDTNVIFAPHGATAILVALQLATAGDSRHQLEVAMGLSINDPRVAAELRVLRRALRGPGHLLAVAEGLFVGQKVTVTPGFVHRFLGTLGPRRLARVDFQRGEEARALLNTWVQEKTRGEHPGGGGGPLGMGVPGHLGALGKGVSGSLGKGGVWVPWKRGCLNPLEKGVPRHLGALGKGVSGSLGKGGAQTPGCPGKGGVWVLWERGCLDPLEKGVPRHLGALGKGVSGSFGKGGVWVPWKRGCLGPLGKGGVWVPWKRGCPDTWVPWELGCLS
uniref:Plasminogen activator inhibitor 1 n=1 Tax=Calidris pygmaea TaxID=425635 RepID=A0A8C3PPY2_9CHAR